MLFRSIPGESGRLVRDEVEARVRQRLVAAGIALVDAPGADALLSVSMYFQCHADSLVCGHHTTFELWQWVELSRDRTNRIAAITWHNSYSSGVSKAELTGLPLRLLADAGSLLNGFVGDYGTANPR